MAEQKIRKQCYWDSNCFLGWLLQERDKIDVLRQVLKAADDGRIEILTSAFTLTEVLLVRGKPKLTGDSRTQVRDFFEQSDILVLPIGRDEGEFAQDLVWDHGVSPKDSLHLATAMLSRVEVFHTYDRALLKKRKFSAQGYQLVVEQPKFL